MLHRCAHILLFLLLFPWSLFSQTVNITILVNTATVPDTIRNSAFVQMRGDRPPLTSDSTSPVIFTRIAGDYWKATAAFAVHDTVQYAFFVNGGRDWHSGMESPPLRTLIVGTNDSTLPLQYIFGSVTDTLQYWRPFAETDSVEILFRVNMELQEDFRDEHRIAAIRGSFPSSSWATSVFLKKEIPHTLPGSRGYEAGNFWSGIVRLPRPIAPTRIDYKFVQHLPADAPTASPLQWEDAIQKSCGATDVDGNRFFILRPDQNDTTLAYKYWRNNECSRLLQRDTVIIDFTINLEKAIQNNNYIVGDSLLLITGLRNTNAILHTQLLKKPTLKFDYIGVDTLVFYEAFKPKRLNYKYVLRRNGKDFEDIYFDFSKLPDTNYTGRSIDLTYTGKTQFRSVKDTARSVYAPNRTPFFRFDRNISQNITLTIVCDLRPAWVHVRYTGDTLFARGAPFIINRADSIYQYGIAINGLGLDSRGWLPWGESLFADASRKMYDDGTHGDAFANDRFYSRTFTLHKDSNAVNTILKEFKFGIRGYDNETGNVLSLNHVSTINDFGSTTRIEVPFGIQFPTYLSSYNYERPDWVDHVQFISATIQSFALNQNYPNPFNPTTSISFSIPPSNGPSVRSSLTIYDLLGRTIATLIDDNLSAGSYSVQWNAVNVPSGVYIYRLTSGAHSIARRMLLLK